MPVFQQREQRVLPFVSRTHNEGTRYRRNRSILSLVLGTTNKKIRRECEYKTFETDEGTAHIT